MSPEDREHPEKLGRYRIEQVIGQGAMGTVYQAYDAVIQRKVAVKSLRLEYFPGREERRRAAEFFLREARVVGNLAHSHITAVYDMGMQGDLPYIVMEFVAGRNLKELIADGNTFPLPEKLALLAMVARALHFAHQRGVLHRDIKPANIMILEASRSPKITDFGIARVLDPGALGVACPAGVGDEETRIPGTPLYMAPEQIRGERLDPRSDLFSLGILAYEWLSGRKPFTGPAIKDQLQAILRQPPVPLTDAEADPELRAIITQALAKRPNERFQSGESFSDALELYLERLARRREAPAGRELAFDQREMIAKLRQKYLFFADFSEEEMFTVFSLSTRERFSQGDYLIRAGTSGARMFVVLRGKVSVLNEKEGRLVEIDTLGEGGCVGEMAMLDGMPRSASVVAIKPTIALAINETVLRHADPRLCLKLYRSLASLVSERLRASDARYLDLVMSLTRRSEETEEE